MSQLFGPALTRIADLLIQYKNSCGISALFRHLGLCIRCLADKVAEDREDPILYLVIAHKLDDINAILRNGYSESDLIDAGLIDLKKEE